MIRVMLVDDQPLVRAGLAMLLGVEPDIEVIAEVGTGSDAVALVATIRPDVVLMDVRMPGMDGVEATRRIVAADMATADPTTKIIMLTTYHVDEAVYAALRAGASGFLLKDAAPRELVDAVRAVASGEAWLDPSVTKGLIREFASRPDSGLPTPTELADLTTREREVLTLVAHGMSNCEVAAHLFVGEATVKTHLSRILMKLGLRDRAQAIAVAYHSGLVLPGTSPPPAGAGP
ncbi:response regulator [Actinophytocola oryzae]|uniref:LuxR family two component transcriptional regulator n=1 Tax=Actinophytocola oryzae TaxID=502181 RepID=A0A4R7W5C0_9PSEU|nr:response regulator transcription factor [Actinophytocola oryzae]TDV57936.1 LuxR family two component transcriptional regulator [Actinophytocola oryzae]